MYMCACMYSSLCLCVCGCMCACLVSWYVYTTSVHIYVYTTSVHIWLCNNEHIELYIRAHIHNTCTYKEEKAK